MENLLKVTTKKLRDTAPGELIRIRAGHSYCFAISLRNQEEHVVGFINRQDPQNQDLPPQSFYLDYPQQNPIVLSYGVHWVIKPSIAAGEEVGASENIERHSPVLHIDKENTYISFSGRPGDGNDAIYFNVDGWRPIDQIHHEFKISIKNWDIWATKEDFLREPNNPLIEIAE